FSLHPLVSTCLSTLSLHDALPILELEYPQGISAAQIVDFFVPRGVKLAQATFRKYVQLGLLPRSRRVGEKGKHRGSRGLYPASADRKSTRLNSSHQIISYAVFCLK